MTGRLSKLVMIWVRAGKHERFRLFEVRAAERIARHGGRIVREWAVEGWSGHQLCSRAPDEVHLVDFANQQSFDAYISAAETLAATDERDELVERTVIVDLGEGSD